MTADPQGWSIRPQPVIGKTEVLCTDETLIRRLKDAAEGIQSSAIYPAFEEGYTHSLFFFDVRPEFVTWVRETAALMPGPRPVIFKQSSGKGLLWAAIALITIALVAGGLYAAGFFDPPAEIRHTEQRRPTDRAAEEPGDVEIAYSDTVTIIDEPAPDATPGGKLDIWFVDVGQGDGIILRLPSGGWIVVDANAGSDDKISALLKKLGCREIKAMVMTHPHLDHIGGIPGVLREFKVGTFYDPGFPHTTSIYEKTLSAVEKNGCRYVQPKPGDKLAWDPKIRVTVLNSLMEEKNPNNSSIVLKIDYGSTSVILTGDAEAEAEDHMVGKFRGRMRAQLLKLGHHGSRSSSTEEFLGEVQPRYAIISCATGNSYRHPHDVTLEKMAKRNVKIYRTDQQGTISASTNGAGWTFKTEKGGN